MASSRWKRFAFFDRHTLNLPSPVLEDLIPSSSSSSSSVGGGGSSEPNATTASGGGGRRRTSASLVNANKSSSSNNSTNASSSKDVPEVSMVIETAALPGNVSATANSPETTAREGESSSSLQQQEQEEQGQEGQQPMAAMLSSLTACSAPQLNAETIRLPSQQQQQQQQQQSTKGATTTTATTTSSTATSGTETDGLVLLWVASPKTCLVHCLDITLRASSAMEQPQQQQQNTSESSSLDLDGWRGYFDGTSPTSAAGGAAGGIVDLATCRRPRRLDVGQQHSQQSPSSQATSSTLTTSSAPLHVACLMETNVVIHLDPHLHLSCRLPIVASTTATTNATTSSNNATTITLASPWNEGLHGRARTMDMMKGNNTTSSNGTANGLLAVGTDTGHVLIFDYTTAHGIALVVTIPPIPPGGLVTSLKLCSSNSSSSSNATTRATTAASTTASSAGSSNKDPVKSNNSIFCTYSRGMGICCFEFSAAKGSIAARHDLDSRHVSSSALTDYYESAATHHVMGGGNSSGSSEGSSVGGGGGHLLVARPDGLYSYSKQQKVGVSPIDGTKNAICAVPPPMSTRKSSSSSSSSSSSANNSGAPSAVLGSAYALVASTDTKSGRDAVDIYDATNKLVAFHVLLSPGHKALRAVGLTTKPIRLSDGNTRGGRSTAVVLTSGGSIVSLTERGTSEKISLLVQKNLYAAAISMAYADPTFQPADITALYRRHAEHLYRKGDFNAAMDQYIYTIGSLESAHVIFRFLDAPKIPMLARYLEELRSRDMATPVHNELLRTCYLKLNDNEAAEKIAASASRTTDTASCSSLVSSLAHNPKEALATVCTFDAPQAAEALVVHGAALARALPRETAGVVVSLCIGTYSPSALAEATGEQAAKMLEVSDDSRPRVSTPYPFHLFASSFVESPKVLRLLLAHCNRNKCPLTPSLRRTLLELTLSEWNDAKRTGDTEAEKLRRKEAITALTDAHCRDIGDYDALVIVQLAGFSEGELLLYERLQMTPMLLARYAQDGGDRARRHMLAMCRTDPEVLADVLDHFVTIASERIQQDHLADDASMNSEEEEILDDIREALALARAQGALPPVRIARILAGEGAGQFSSDAVRYEKKQSSHQTVPLSVALDYVGAILDDSRHEISRLKSEVEEYNHLCNNMEAEVDSLLSGQTPADSITKQSPTNRMNIEELHSKLMSALEEGSRSENSSAQSREAFWREINQSEDRYDTIARFFAKGIMQ